MDVVAGQAIRQAAIMDMIAANSLYNSNEDRTCFDGSQKQLDQGLFEPETLL